ncbi:MAG: hypothetical protein HY372_03455 [Candidatus Andersenbacteria bacterium]|nr:hypothetical protein [Candidatus Andersenbacteria bacterium]
MHHTRHRARLLTTIGAALALTLLPLAASASHNNGTYDYHIGDTFLTDLFPDADPPVGPDISEARNGDMVEVTGTGTMTIQTGRDEVTGGGTFVHKDADGDIIATGTWTAERLLSFRSYGNGTPQGLPEDFFGGVARLRVHLTPDGDGEGFDATLKIDCTIGSRIPASAMEGIELNVRGRAPNFRTEISGATVFVKTGP